MLHARERVHLCLDCRCHERCKPPGHHLCPESGMHNVKGFQILLVPVEKIGDDGKKIVRTRNMYTSRKAYTVSIGSKMNHAVLGRTNHFR